MTDINAQVAALAGAGYEVVYADPPWRFKSNSLAKPGRNAARHYPTMSLDEIEAIPVRGMVAEDAALFMWVPPSFIVIGAHIPIMTAWGFKPSSFAFTWVKIKSSVPWHHKVRDAELHLGMGLTTRKQCEQIVLGVRGKSLRAESLPEVIFASVREHSRKPEEAALRIARYVGPGREMVEMFSRETSPGFYPLGNEAGKFDAGRAADA